MSRVKQNMVVWERNTYEKGGTLRHFFMPEEKMLILLILSILPKRYLRESRAKVRDLSAYSQMTCISGSQLLSSDVLVHKQRNKYNTWTGEQGMSPQNRENRLWEGKSRLMGYSLLTLDIKCDVYFLKNIIHQDQRFIYACVHLFNKHLLNSCHEH